MSKDPQKSTKDIADILGGEVDAEAGIEGELQHDEVVDLPPAKELYQQLQSAQEKANQHWELYLQAKADAENIRRRSETEVSKAKKFAVERFVKEILPILDSLERSLEAIDITDEALKGVREGAELTLKIALQSLEKLQVTQTDPFGEPFDPAFHEAISMQEQVDAEPGTVLNVVQKGYLLHERVIRPAMVVVAKGAGGVDKKA